MLTLVAVSATPNGKNVQLKSFETDFKDMENLLRTLGISTNNIDITPSTPINLIQDSPEAEWPIITAYTDGSKTKTTKPTAERTGAGAVIYFQNDTQELTQPLAPTNTINQAELKAIEMVADHLLQRSITNHNIVIKSDSKTTIQKLFGYTSRSKQLTNTIEKLQRLKESNMLIIEKVKAHTNIEGNEKADQLAKKAALQSTNTPNKIGLVNSQIYNLVQEYLQKKNKTDMIKKQYNDFTTAILTKIHDIPYNIRITNKQLLKELTQAISGQNMLAASRHHQDNKINPNCDLCDSKENSEHVLLYCPKLDELRFRLDYNNITNEIYGDEQLDWHKFAKLVKKCNLFT